MTENQRKFYNLIITTLVDSKLDSEEEIDMYIKNFMALPMFSNLLTTDDISAVRKLIIAERSIKLANGYLVENKNHEKWFLNRKSLLDMKYWERYKKYLLQTNHFQTNVVNTMDDVIDTLTDLLGDPQRSDEFQRRGLIIGDVQSGKTANYTGLICKASDAGYKVVVLMTGTIEKLRRQTQMRLDEGFVGLDSDAMIKQKEDSNIGVGVYDPSIHPMVLTSTYDDFKAKNASNLGFNLQTVNGTVLFVVKKNVSVLKRLNQWLKKSKQSDIDKINHSLLVIDDEADNASVNTNPEDRDPTATNKWIREILNNFTRASYVGFTATPFANIFIDPDTNEKMVNENLFPKDYIYSLNAPSNYIGARNIFGEDANYSDMLLEINTAETEKIEFLPVKHKAEHIVGDIPYDLKKAINAFFLVNAIRDIRENEISSHRSMLINMSRFVAVQEQLGHIVNAYVKELQASLRLNTFKPLEEAVKDRDIAFLFETYNELYCHSNLRWEQILKKLYASTVPIKVFIVNQKNVNSLNYEEYMEHGLRAIAIGGLSLSRGLTLEGLAISYFYRNSKTYDTLMQMGRWFGYRGSYADLCRVWMTDESITWYRHINEATDELRADVKKYQDTDLTPMDFGLRVRSDINTLLVTARNKMRAAETKTITTSLSGIPIETPELFTDSVKNRENVKCINNLVEDIISKGNSIYKFKKDNSTKTTYGFVGVKKSFITDFLLDYQVTSHDTVFDTETIRNFIEKYAGSELDKWDIAFIGGSSDKTFEITEGIYVNRIKRSFSLINDKKIAKMLGSKRRLGNTSDGEFNLDTDKLEKIKNVVEQRNINEGTDKSLKQKDYFNIIQRAPLLCIYPIELTDISNDKETHDENTVEKIKSDFNKDTPMIGIGIGIPLLSDAETKYATYVINKIQQRLMETEDYDIGDEE